MHKMDYDLNNPIQSLDLCSNDLLRFIFTKIIFSHQFINNYIYMKSEAKLPSA